MFLMMINKKNFKTNLKWNKKWEKERKKGGGESRLYSWIRFGTGETFSDQQIWETTVEKVGKKEEM